MILCLTLLTTSKVLAIIGLFLDIYGVYKLFVLEPKPLNEANEIIFDATIGDWTNLEKVKHIVSELNKNVQDLRFETQQLRRKSKKYIWIIIIGFFMQFISIFLTFFYH